MFASTFMERPTFLPTSLVITNWPHPAQAAELDLQAQLDQPARRDQPDRKDQLEQQDHKDQPDRKDQ
jgi:hypothetical protein